MEHSLQMEDDAVSEDLVDIEISDSEKEESTDKRNLLNYLFTYSFIHSIIHITTFARYEICKDSTGG